MNRFAPQSWLGRRVDAAIRSTVPACFSRCRGTGRIERFAIAAGKKTGAVSGRRYDDSDVMKSLEGAAAALRIRRDPNLEAEAKEIVDLVRASARPDGYVNSWISVCAPKEQWKDIGSGHELYCAGHLIEAGIALREATEDRTLLDVAIRFAEHIDATFGEGRRNEPPGHPEIEVALVRLFRATGDRRWSDLARFFLEARGRHEGRESYGEYSQDHAPVRQQREARGHAVRALYLYRGAAEVAALDGDEELLDAVRACFDDVTARKSYVTGGVGSSAENEGFTAPFDLPLTGAYCETCASVALVMLARRLLEITGDARYADRMEHVLQNALLAGVSLDGEKFFYSNPLVSDGSHRRQPWFDCACCPTNIARFLPRLADLAIVDLEGGPGIALYGAGDFATTTLTGAVHLAVETTYPLDGTIFVGVNPERRGRFSLSFRVPSWVSRRPAVRVNGSPTASSTRNGWITIEREWREGDEVALGIPLVPERIEPPPEVLLLGDRVALRRGPLVFCVEGTDHGNSLDPVALPRDARMETTFDSDIPGGTVSLRWDAASGQCRAIPYAHWAHRNAGEMAVWLPVE